MSGLGSRCWPREPAESAPRTMPREAHRSGLQPTPTCAGGEGGSHLLQRAAASQQPVLPGRRTRRAPLLPDAGSAACEPPSPWPRSRQSKATCSSDTHTRKACPGGLRRSRRCSAARRSRCRAPTPSPVRRARPSRSRPISAESQQRATRPLPWWFRSSAARRAGASPSPSEPSRRRGWHGSSATALAETCIRRPPRT